MIYLEMAGRLGNQLFRYAFARRIQEITGEELYIDFKRVYQKGTEEQGWTNSLKLFKTAKYFEVNDKKKDLFFDNATIMQKIIYFLYKVGNQIFKNNKNKLIKYQLKMQPLLNKYNLYFIELGYYKYNFEYLNKHKVKYICGCFECENYFTDIKDIILKEFEPIKEKEPKNKKLYEKIKETNSVCISIRRGDFVTNEKNSKLYNICDINYYTKAIQLMREKIDNPVLFVFSDDIKWAKENIKFEGIQIFYEDGNDTVDEKLRLMYSCKHFIISNSTFSWWAQFLSRNQDKIVIAPSRWYKNDVHSDLINKNWIKIEV